MNIWPTITNLYLKIIRNIRPGMVVTVDRHDETRPVIYVGPASQPWRAIVIDDGADPDDRPGYRISYAGEQFRARTVDARDLR